MGVGGFLHVGAGNQLLAGAESCRILGALQESLAKWPAEGLHNGRAMAPQRDGSQERIVGFYFYH